MARIEVPVTQTALKRIVAPSPERRVIALELLAPAGAGNSDFYYTPPLGNRLWLYTIDVWVYCVSPAGGIGGFFWLMYGTGIPSSDDEVAVKWNHIIPSYGGVKAGFLWSDCESFHRRFTMAKLFNMNELRFAVAVNNGGTQAWMTTVAFEIAEG